MAHPRYFLAFPLMTNVDTSKLSYSELVALSKQLDQQIAERRSEELKVLADGFAKKLEAAGFTVAEALEALQPYAIIRASKPAFGKPKRVLYRDSANPENTWSGRGRGRAAGWITAYEAQGRTRAEFKVATA